MTYTQEKGGTGKPMDVFLPRRCLQVQSGRARYEFTHEIKNGNLLGERRVSVTFRESTLTTTRPADKRASPWAAASSLAAPASTQQGLVLPLLQQPRQREGGSSFPREGCQGEETCAVVLCWEKNTK